MEVKIKYNKGDVTILWQPAKCIHSAICVKGLPSVFRPVKRPWVDMEAGTVEEIVEQVKKCPSGALSFCSNEEQKDYK